LKARERLAAKKATGGTGEPPKSILSKPADASKSTPTPQDKVSDSPTPYSLNLPGCCPLTKMHHSISKNYSEFESHVEI
jgi:hypothetical protein